MWDESTNPLPNFNGYNGYDYLSMRVLKLNNVSKRGHCMYPLISHKTKSGIYRIHTLTSKEWRRWPIHVNWLQRAPFTLMSNVVSRMSRPRTSQPNSKVRIENIEYINGRYIYHGSCQSQRLNVCSGQPIFISFTISIQSSTTIWVRKDTRYVMFSTGVPFTNIFHL